MTNPFQIESSYDVIEIALWSIMLVSVIYAVFHSMPAAWLRKKLYPKSDSVQREIQILYWELHNKASYTKELADGNPHAARVALSAAELDERRAKLRKLQHINPAAKVVLYFLGCAHCQGFWMSLLIYTVSNWPHVTVAECIGAAFTYALLCALFVRFAMRDMAKNNYQRQEQACPGCGK